MLFIQSGQSCLHAAAISGHVNVIKALLNKGAHIEARTKVVSLIFIKHVGLMGNSVSTKTKPTTF